MDGLPVAISHYDAMVANRQQFLASWLAWCSAIPAGSLVDQEVAATCSAINQIADLALLTENVG
jgi:hypothetical protein